MSFDAPHSGDLALQVRGLAKRYRIGALRERFRYDTLRDAIASQARRLIRPVGRTADDHIWALDDVSFDVRCGEVVGVVGRNGAGKSTLLKILSRITKPTRGSARVWGRLGSLLEVGTGFHPELTGRDNIFLNGAILGMRRHEIAKRFDAIVEFAGIGAFLDTPVKRYSSGMYVRLAFAVAAHLEPDILVVDEVLAVGDAEFQRKCLGKMQSVVSHGRTILFVSHNLAAVKSLCHRAILLDRGRIAADGSVDAVVDRYLSTGSGASTDGWIPSDAQRVGTGEIRIRRVAIHNRRGEPVSQLYFGQPFLVVLDVEALAPVSDAFIAVGISTLDGTRVATSFSSDRNRPAFSFGPGGSRVSVEIELTLLPRAYTLDCSIFRSSGYDVDTVQRVYDFSALAVAESGADAYRWTVRGFVRPDATWHAPEPLLQQSVPLEERA
jgi:lipopolysaccharide transport system ATP-binding protein